MNNHPVWKLAFQSDQGLIFMFRFYLMNHYVRNYVLKDLILILGFEYKALKELLLEKEFEK